MSAEYADNVLAETVYADDCGVGVLILYERGDGAYTDAHCSNKDKGVKVFPALFDHTSVKKHEPALFL